MKDEEFRRMFCRLLELCIQVNISDSEMPGKILNALK
jgi:hypothetical protein